MYGVGPHCTLERAVCFSLLRGQVLATPESRLIRRWLSIQRQHFDIPVPAVPAVVLQADVPLAGMVLVGNIELVVAAIRTLVRLSPFIKVHARHALTVQLDLDDVLPAGD